MVEQSTCAVRRPGLDLPRLILMLRPDLCRRFGFDQSGKADVFLAWLLTTGMREYAALKHDVQFAAYVAETDPELGVTRLQASIYRARPDVQAVHGLPAQRDEFLQWFWVHGVGEHALWDLLSSSEKRDVLQATEEALSPWLDDLQAKAAQPEARGHQGLHRRPFGVNLIGYAFGQLGIGEDLRMTLRALKAANIPLAVVNFPPSQDVAQNDCSIARHVLKQGEDGPYAINLFCMTALETARFYAERGPGQWAGRYTIAYWPWELSQWPTEWKMAFDLVDEVWVSTTHIRDALLQTEQPSFAKPLHVMPLVVEVGASARRQRWPEVRRATRQRFSLPQGARLFCFSFDLNSSIHRKNPQAVVQAFLRAFDAPAYSARKVGLVVKVHAPQRPHRAWQALKALAAQDPRIHIIEGTLPRDELLALYAACDCFVSLHRAEGFGRGLAEALQLGLHLITTDYSGNTDFCRRPELAPQISPVPYRLVKVRPGQYPYATGQVWASPSIAAAARVMKHLVDTKLPSANVPRGGWPCFSAKVLGALYAKRLCEVSPLFL